jgi:parvulin-like peptidyl-prolyl cis-trans isomerase-like protein
VLAVTNFGRKLHRPARRGLKPIIVLLMLVPACRADRGVPDPVVLELGEQVVRRSDFERHLAAVEARGKAPLAPEVRTALFEPFLEERVLELDARARGLIREGATAAEAQAAVEQLLATEVLAKVEVGPEEVKQHCQEHLGDFDRPEMIVLRQIVVPTSNEARDIRRRLLREPRSFEALARTQSRGPEAAAGGLMGTFAHGELPPQLEAAAFALAQGATSQIVSTPFGHHVLRVDERRPARPATPDECRARVEPSLKREKADRAVREFVRSIMARAKVNHEAVKAPAAGR